MYVICFDEESTFDRVQIRGLQFKNNKMTNTKIKLDNNLLTKISSSNEISAVEKIHFMKYIGYMTNSERKELSELL